MSSSIVENILKSLQETLSSAGNTLNKFTSGVPTTYSPLLYRGTKNPIVDPAFVFFAKEMDAFGLEAAFGETSKNLEDAFPEEATQLTTFYREFRSGTLGITNRESLHTAIVQLKAREDNKLKEDDETKKQARDKAYQELLKKINLITRQQLMGNVYEHAIKPESGIDIGVIDQKSGLLFSDFFGTTLSKTGNHYTIEFHKLSSSSQKSAQIEKAVFAIAAHSKHDEHGNPTGILVIDVSHVIKNHDRDSPATAKRIAQEAYRFGLLNGFSSNQIEVKGCSIDATQMVKEVQETQDALNRLYDERKYKPHTGMNLPPPTASGKFKVQTGKLPTQQRKVEVKLCDQPLGRAFKPNPQTEALNPKDSLLIEAGADDNKSEEKSSPPLSP